MALRKQFEKETGINPLNEEPALNTCECDFCKYVKWLEKRLNKYIEEEEHINKHFERIREELIK